MPEFGKRNPDRPKPPEEQPSEFLRRNLRNPEINAAVKEILESLGKVYPATSDLDRTDINKQYAIIKNKVRDLSGGKHEVSDEDISTLISDYQKPAPSQE